MNGMSPGAPAFDDPDLASRIGEMAASDIDALPFGAIRLDNQQTVVFYSAAERRLSGYHKPVIGRHFFTEIAPCMNTLSFRGRVERALQSGTLNIEFDHVGDFDDAAKDIRVRVQPAPDGGCWLFLRRGR
jgi:photoactive yellow protein